MRAARRNGHRDRDWDTRADRFALNLAKNRVLPTQSARADSDRVPFAVEDPALPVKWQVIGLFANRHMGQQNRSEAATLEGARM